MAINKALLDRVKKVSTIKESDVLSESKFFTAKELITTPIPMLNAAQSGALDGGFASGLTVWAGPSKHFKTNFLLANLAAYLEKYSDAIAVFYDSEFGTPQGYFKSFGIDTSRILHVPITDVEQLKFDIMQLLQEIKRGDRVFIAIDSIGNLASKKEVEDALEGSSKADMTRAKQLKSLFRMVTPHFTIKDIPCHVVNHTYMTQEMYSKAVVSGGCLVEGTPVMMFDGSLQAIESVKVGQMVSTLDGPKLVEKTWTPETLEFGEPECYEIEFEDGTKVQCSNHHPFLIDGEWIDAEDLREGMIAKTL